MTVAARRVAAVTWLAVAFGVTGQAAAAPIVDQQNVIPIVPGSYMSDQSSQQTLGTYSQYAQTFTVGVAGVLTRVELEVFHGPFTNGNATVDLETATGADMPGGSPLATWDITQAGSSDTVGSFVGHDLGSDAFAVSPGEVYAIIFTWLPPARQTFSGFEWVRGVSDTYAGGGAFFSTFGANPTPWAANPYDYGFRTFVDVAPGALPEPSTLILLVPELLGLAWLRRKNVAQQRLRRHVRR